MGESQQNKRAQEHGAQLARKQTRRSSLREEPPKEGTRGDQNTSILESLPDSLIACDRQGKIVRLNDAALKLFEVASEEPYRGTSFRQFLRHYEMREEVPRPKSSHPWLVSLITDQELSLLYKKNIVLRVPSGREIRVNICRSPLVDPQRRHPKGTLYLFRDITHPCQKALQLQGAHQALLLLLDAIAHIPEHPPGSLPEGTLLLSPPMQFIVQQLVDLICQVLDYEHVCLMASGPPATCLHYVAGSGFTPEQEHYWRKIGEGTSPSDLFDETVIARLCANQEVTLPLDRLRMPSRFRRAFHDGNLLLVPLFLEQQWTGALILFKTGFESVYTPEEVALVKAVAAQTMLIVECLRYLDQQAEARSRRLVFQEMNRLSSEFLALASHELRTPLTGILGNIQLARRRLKALKHQLARHPERINHHLEHVSDALESASQSAQLQQRMIGDMTDDARIQANTLELNIQPCNLIALLREVVAKRQAAVPERAINLGILSTEKRIHILADANRLKQVIDTYLANALHSSPADQPVTVRLTTEKGEVGISVQDEGPGIPVEEQGRLWERFYRAKGSTIQHELDLSLGLGLYLCQVVIERHHGRVGVQSEPGHGATFWFSLPLATSSPDEK